MGQEVTMTTCFECDNPATQTHHVVPVSLGGTRTVPLCEACHGLIHGRQRLFVSELSKAANVKRRAAGQRIGQISYGQRLGADGDTLEDDPTEQRVLTVVRRLRAEGLSYARIAARLEEYGVPARGARWHATTIARLLKR